MTCRCHPHLRLFGLAGGHYLAERLLQLRERLTSFVNRDIVNPLFGANMLTACGGLAASMMRAMM